MRNQILKFRLRHNCGQLLLAVRLPGLLAVLVCTVLQIWILPGMHIGPFANDPADKQSPEAQFWNDELKPFLSNFCYDCHSGSGAEADVDFEQFATLDSLTEQRARWDQVRGLIEIGAMPPPDHDPLPTMEQRDKIADWIDRKLNTVDCQIVHDPGRVTMRRLNNSEYDNTLRDLLGIKFSPSDLIGFPSDGVGNGFDNQGDVLTLSPLQLEKYFQSAKMVFNAIVVRDPESLREQRKDIRALYPGDEEGVEFLFGDGEYEVQARVKFEETTEERKIPVLLKIDGQQVKQLDVDPKHQTFRVDHNFTAGWHRVSLHFAEDPHEDGKEYKRRIETDYIGIEGPRDGNPALPESHRRLFVAMPGEENTVEQAARKIFEPLMRRAFRRDLNSLEVDRIVSLVRMASEEGQSFEDAVGLGLQAVLVSPNFLFRIESEPADGVSAESTAGQETGSSGSSVGVGPYGTQSLSDFALASRLSYFLWASAPDDELLDAASRGELSHPAVLQAQAKRMLTDSRSDAIVKRFFSQYLGLGNLRDVDPDPEKFTLWNDELRDAMRKETHLFCQEFINRDLPLDQLLNGDFTFVNPRLAELYDIEFDGEDPKELYRNGPGYNRESSRDRNGRYRDEDRWIRISLPAGRKGVLTQAAVLTLTSNPTSTSPVKRGKWILESLLGDPPPPAPPNVPGFEETTKEHANLSLRQQLEIHRQNPSCASCHRVMDPLGLGFENFDAVGRWRDRDGEHPIDAGGELADGRKFNGSVELINLLRQRQPEIFRHFAKKLLTYALGRGLEPYDNCAVDEVMAHAGQHDFRFSSFVDAIVVSEPFSRRRSGL